MFAYIRYALPSNDVEVRKMISAKQQQIEDMSVDIKLTSHKRVVQVVNIPSHQLSILLQIIMSSIPQSINFSLKKVRLCLCTVNVFYLYVKIKTTVQLKSKPRFKVLKLKYLYLPLFWNYLDYTGCPRSP